VIEFKIPEVGEGINSGTVVSILVKPGDKVAKDQALLELETDKAVVEIPSDVEGTVAEVLIKENQEVEIGQAVLKIDENAGAVADNEKSEENTAEKLAEKPLKEEAVKKETVVEKTKATTQSQSDATSKDLIPAAPSVRRMAREMGIDIHQVKGSGILGRISVHDLTTQGSSPGQVNLAQIALPDFSKWGQVRRVPMTGIRKATVRSMTAAWANVPMVTHFDKADIDNFEAFRQRYKVVAERKGIKLTPTAILLKIVASALKKFPDFNASIDTNSQEIIYKDYINIGVAVDTPNGLLVPVIKNADQKSILELARELSELAEKARNRKLGLEDMQGGNFTISNLGGIGGYGFTPIVNPPEVAILGVSRSAMEPVYDKLSQSFEAKLMMPLSLTYDHRLIDGAAAARFSAWLTQAIAEPLFMSLD